MSHPIRLPFGFDGGEWVRGGRRFGRGIVAAVSRGGVRGGGEGAEETSGTAQSEGGGGTEEDHGECDGSYSHDYSVWRFVRPMMCSLMLLVGVRASMMLLVI